MGRRSDHSREELQDLIVEQTLALVKQQGADKVTARQIAKAIGYTPGTLYSLFSNLEDIFQHVNELGLKALFDLCTESMKDQPDAGLAIRALSMAYLNFSAEHTHQFDLMFARVDSHDSPTPASTTHKISNLFALIETQLTRLNPSASEDNVRLGARTLWSGVHGAATLQLSDQLYLDANENAEDLLNYLIDNFLHSWKAS